ncbi:glutamine amidotransferase [bacterium]|jgi:CobQ-like glutamine amidotransferase family enzyme|nr:glutamine amidotransferase [bacterium]MDA9359692.1 glutamine amidotransferase [bacterium]
MNAAYTVRLCHLYPEMMNIYADRGNIAVFRQRLAWRDMALEITEIGLGDIIDPGQHDLYYLGGGQDRDQNLVAKDLVANAATLQAAAHAGAAQLYVCGGIQLAGHQYVTADGTSLPGLGILDLVTEAGATRLIGDLVIEATIEGTTQRVVGYENHAGRTRLGASCVPLGRVVSGHGNDGESGNEGAVLNHVIGTYLHGPLLPKNPWLADLLLGWALEHRYGRDVALRPLEDAVEARAHTAAIGRAGVRR